MSPALILAALDVPWTTVKVYDPDTATYAKTTKAAARRLVRLVGEMQATSERNVVECTQTLLLRAVA